MTKQTVLLKKNYKNTYEVRLLKISNNLRDFKEFLRAIICRCEVHIVIET